MDSRKMRKDQAVTLSLQINLTVFGVRKL